MDEEKSVPPPRLVIPLPIANAFICKHRDKLAVGATQIPRDTFLDAVGPSKHRWQDWHLLHRPDSNS